MWDDTIAALTLQAGGSPVRMLALDAPGCGSKRERPVDGITLDDIAEELIGDIEAAALSKPLLVGHLQGGQVMSLMLHKRPDLFGRAVYVTCSIPLPGQTVIAMMGTSLHGVVPDEVGWPFVIFLRVGGHGRPIGCGSVWRILATACGWSTMWKPCRSPPPRSSARCSVSHASGTARSRTMARPLPCPTTGQLQASPAGRHLPDTPIAERLFDDALVRYATASHRDVVLVRAGLHPEVLDPVRVDVALRSSCGGAVLVPDLSFYRAADGALHLVPERHDLFVAVAGHGLDVLLVAPWDTLDERAEGLERAAAEIVRACRRARTDEQAD